MGIFDEEIKLPGVLTQVEADYSYGFDQSSFGTTDSIVIIGTAFNGPVGVPTPVYSVEHAVYIFGEAYDSRTRREATLVAGVEDAWKRGARTIYCVRVSGKELHKDFNLRIGSRYKVRVTSQFPSNVGKECYFAYANTPGEEKITFYKPASRATISEKRRGAVVNEHSVLKTALSLHTDYALTARDRLVDLISIFNNHVYNNVLKMSIVDQDGVDVTSSPEVYNIPIDALHPGVYFIGRDHSKCAERTELDFQVIGTDDETNFAGVDEQFYRTLKINTDVAQPLPIFTDVSNTNLFNRTLGEVSITGAANLEFLEVAELSNRAFALNTEDYEEVNLSSFDVYKRLGSGFAITAMATKRTMKGKETTPRISETPASDPNRTVPLTEGIYGMLEDAEIKYRVLTCASAEEKIKGKLPRAEDFKVATAIPAPMKAVDQAIVLLPKVQKDDFTDAKKYKVTIHKAKAPEDLVVTDIEKIYTKEIMPVVAGFTGDIAAVEKSVKEGKIQKGQHIYLTDSNELYRIGEKGVKKLNDASYIGKHFLVNGDIIEGTKKDNGGSNPDTTEFKKKTDLSNKFEEKDFILGTVLDDVFVFKIADDKAKPIGDFDSVFQPAGENPMVVAYAESLAGGKENDVIISSAMFDNITVEELVEIINTHPTLGRLFEASVSKAVSKDITKDTFMNEALGITEEDADTEKDIEALTIEKDREIEYDYNKRVPYRTNDNFVRQLAQHCAYTELKTTPTYGFVGCRRLVNTGLTAIANKVNELSMYNFDIYAKTNTGRNMLDRQNLPFHIGKNVNVVFAQYPVVMENSNYAYVSNGAAGYAGMVSTLPLDQSSTSQKIDIPELDFICSKFQLEQLTAAGIVTLRRSFTKGIVVTDGITMAQADSVFRRLSSARIAGAVEDLIRQASEPFIGKQNNPAIVSALTTAIRSSLDKIVGVLVNDYDFKLNNDPSLAKFSMIELNYRVVPIYEIREIRNNIKVTDTLGTNSTTH